MRKFILLTFVVFIICFIYYKYNNHLILKNNIEIYNDYTDNFKRIDVKDIYSKIDNGDNFFLYVGRSTCQWCRKFVPILHELSLNRNIIVYYLDSEDTNINFQLKNFREFNDIQEIPYFSFYGKNNRFNKIYFNPMEKDFDVKFLEDAVDIIINDIYEMR